MQKRERTRLVCMNCLHSKIVDKQKDDPKESRLIVLWACYKCSEKSYEPKFYDFQMKQIWF